MIQNDSMAARVSSLFLIFMLVLSATGARSYSGEMPSAIAAARFLQQASWGPTPATVAHIQDVGFDRYIEEQFLAPMSPITVPPPAANGRIPMRPVQDQFFYNAVHGGDQLRQRVMFALNQIWVVSGVKVKEAAAMVNYLQVLQKDAFANYSDVMYDVTLSPAMGYYLDMVNNDKPNPRTGKGANENYAREFMQLFTIGLVELSKDGTVIRDDSGSPVDTFTQENIEGFARAFTGWTYAPSPGATPRAHNPAIWNEPMVPWNNNHDTDSKALLNGVTLPPKQDAQQDLNDALNNVFMHPNVGPFVCRQLIQHLVTSNPSPAYVRRVTRVFDGGARPRPGRGNLELLQRGNDTRAATARGDMKAVIKAILLDPEARAGDNGDADASPGEGHLREPVLFINGLLRALNATLSSENGLAPAGSEMGQNIYFPPTVFNYFAPDYEIPATTINAPEFQIFSPATAMVRADFVNNLIYGKIAGVAVDLAPFMGQPDADRMLDLLGDWLMWGRMPGNMRQAIRNAIDVAPTAKAKLQAAVYLICSSSQYQVQR